MAETAPQTVFNLLILDESGSMETVRELTVRGFNELVQTVQGMALEFPARQQVVGLTTFNGLGIREQLFMQPAGALRPLALADYRPTGGTPLLDAIGQSVSKLRQTLLATGAKDYEVLVTILTDGEENTSHTFSRAAVRELIDTLKTQGWTFAYLGTDHDVTAVADSLGIDDRMAFSKNPADMDAMFAQERALRRQYNRKPAAERGQGSYFTLDADDSAAAAPAEGTPQP